MVQKKLKKIKVAFIISNNSNWLGEVNYFKSLIGSINELEKDIPIKLYVLTSKFEKYFNKKKYKNLSIIQTSFLNSGGFLPFIRKVLSNLFRNYDPIISYLLKKYGFLMDRENLKLLTSQN